MYHIGMMKRQQQTTKFKEDLCCIWFWLYEVVFKSHKFPL